MELLFFLFIVLPMISAVWLVILFLGAAFTSMSVEAFRERLKGHAREKRESQETQERIRQQEKALEESRRAVGDTDEVLMPWQVRRLAAQEEPLRIEEEQHQFAARVVERAEEARQVRAEVKELLQTGSLTVPGLLERADSDETLARMKVLAMLESLPTLDKAAAHRAMREIGIDESRRLSGLGPKQRSTLINRFG